jgi:ATP-dependent helicase/nuclease subunit A
MGLNLTNQQQKALDTERHISLTANAGSGKTFVLKNRFVNILLQEGISLNNIVAITFTEKAAAKLYKDIAGEIDRRIKEEQDKDIVLKLQNYRRDLVSANISTIHSFCIQLLKEFSTEAQIDINFTPIDEIISKELLKLSFETAYRMINRTDSEISETIKYLVRFFGAKDFLASVIFQLIDKRAKIYELYSDLLSLPEEEILNKMDELINEKFNLLYDEKIKDIIYKINLINDVAADVLKKDKAITVEVSDILGRYDKNLNVREKLKIFKDLSDKILTKNGTVKKRGYLSLKSGHEYEAIVSEIEEFDIWKKVQGEIGGIEEDKEYINFCKRLFLFFNEVNKIYEQKKESNNFLDFEDLLLKTTNIVKNPEVVEILAERYKYIMIDEYQDTNDTQYNIFMPILKYLQVNNLFVVGDEKQSIYYFRNADLELFDITKKLIKEKDALGNLELTHSFRVSPKIALFTNLLFSKLMTENNSKFNEVDYSPLICARNTEDLDVGEISFLLTTKDESQADLVSKKIIEMLLTNKIKSLNDVAVLCREKADFEELEKSFSAHKINYSVIGGMGFYQNQMSSDLYHFLNFVNNPDSDLSLVALMRSPFISLSDTQIALISLKEGNTFFEKFKNYALEDNSVVDSFNLIDKCVKLFEFNEPEDVLRIFLTESGYWGILAVRNTWQQEIANLEKFIQIVLSAFERSFFSYYDFLRQLDDFIETFYQENQAQVNSSYPSVKMMTIHKSKGLEFDTVILYNTTGKLKYSNIKSKDVKFEKEFGFMTKIPLAGNYSCDYVYPIWGILGESNIIKKEHAEHKRVFYVAVTRAINNLIISAKYEQNKSTPNSFFSFIRNVFNINFDAEYFEISGNLDFLKDGAISLSKNLSFKVNIIKDINVDLEGFFNKNEKKVDADNKEFLLHEVYDTPKYELFTASKYLAYKFCPINYNLTYEYSYPKLLNLLNKQYVEEEYAKEDDVEINNEALKIGVVCHEILSTLRDLNDLENNIIKKVDKFLLDEKERLILIDKVKKLIIPFVNSENFKKISKLENSYNEYEINKVIDNYYFIGIIDKLIIEDNKIIIIDYKTNNVNSSNINEKVEYYVPQLKFYSFLVAALFGREREIYIRLMFLALPEFEFEVKVEKDEIELLENELKTAIDNIRSNNFKSNSKSCYICNYKNICKESIFNKR